MILGFLLLIQSPFSLSNLSNNFDATHNFFTTQETNFQNTATTKNGNGYIISCDSKISQSISQKLFKSKLLGESFEFYGNKNDVNKILRQLEAKVLKTENFENFCIIYAYSPKICESITQNKQKINLQIAIKNNKIKVGTPLILDSF